MIAWLARAVKRHCERRPPDFIIGSKEDPYMLRWWFIPRNKYFNIYLHNMKKDDEDRALHDHPWWSLSLALSGGLTEVYCKEPPKGEVLTRHITAGQWVFRSGRFAHKLQVTGEAWTIFITGPVFRKWGFWCPHSWRFWQDFVDARDHGKVGRGCD
jgi:hypothetical protein